MKRITLICSVAIKVYAQSDDETPRDCFTASSSSFGDSSAGTQLNDLDKLSSLTEDHVLTSIRCCQGVADVISSAQITYGIWTDDGRLTESISLNEIGNDTGSCSFFQVQKGDSVKSFTIIYSSNQVTQLNYSTTDGFIGTVGSSSNRDSTKAYSFDQTNYKFYGLYGTDDGFIASLGVIRIDARCLKNKVYELGDDFGWDVTVADVSADSTGSDAVQNDEAAVG